MSIPINQLVFAGTWDVATIYNEFQMVISPIDNGCYVKITLLPSSGGPDPSVQPSTVWVLIPQPAAGDITGVIAGTGLSGGGSTGNVTLDNTGVLSATAGTGISVSAGASPTISNTGVLALDGMGGVLTTKVGQYYLTSAQNLTSGNTDIIFQDSQSWTDLTAISWTAPSANFTVAVKGLYQLEFNALIALNTTTLSTTTNRAIAIDITRPPTAETGVIATNCFTVLGQNYQLSTSGSIALEVGDVINCRLGVVFSGGAPIAQPISGFDLNTFFTWTLIKPLPP